MRPKRHFPILLLFLAGCAGTAEPRAAELRDADWIVGAWRLDSYIKSGVEQRDLRLQLTFHSDGFVDLINQDARSTVPVHCRWYPRMNRVDTSCAGVDLRIRENPSGPPAVEIYGGISVPYYVDECAQWATDSSGNRVCVYYRQVERFRTVSGRGEGVLEPYSRPD